MFVEPVPWTYHWLGGVPGKQFSASIAFLGAVQLANAENARQTCATVNNSSRNASRRQESADGRRVEVADGRIFHDRAECARRRVLEGTCSRAFTRFNEFMAHRRMNLTHSVLFLGLYRCSLALIASSEHARIIDAAETAFNRVRPVLSNRVNS